MGDFSLKVLNIVKKYKWEFAAVVFLIIGSLVRLVALGSVPNGLNVDEASSGYDAWSIMRYGIDRGGNSYPVYLYAWGSGQSALYSYLMIPVLALGGLTEFTMRLPMAIFGVVSLIVFYFLVRNIFDDKRLSLVALGFFAICPWHIMKSRWGMECNLFPDLVLLAVCLLVLGLKREKIWLQVLAFVTLALSSYAYGTSYLFLPVFVVGLLVYLIGKKKLTFRRSMVYLFLMGLLCAPIILYVFVNSFGLEPIRLGSVTIPRLQANRYEETTTVFSGNVFENCVNNLIDLLRLLIIQNDNLPWNAVHGYGMFYLVSVVFFVVGVWAAVKKYGDNEFNQIMNIWMIASVVLGAFCLININRINIIMIPCIYYVSLGLYVVFEKYKTMIPCIMVIYVYLFVGFLSAYWKSDYNEYLTFSSGVKEVAEYCESSEADVVYCYYSFKEPFIYFMFYNRSDVHEYLDTVEYFEEGRTFDNVKAYGKYRFYLPDEIEEGCLVIVPRGTVLEYGVEPREKNSFEKFDVYVF